MGALTSTLEDLNGKMHKGGAALGTAAECQACCSRNLGLYLAERATGLASSKPNAKDSRRRRQRLLRAAAVATGMPEPQPSPKPPPKAANHPNPSPRFLGSTPVHSAPAAASSLIAPGVLGEAVPPPHSLVAASSAAVSSGAGASVAGRTQAAGRGGAPPPSPEPSSQSFVDSRPSPTPTHQGGGGGELPPPGSPPGSPDLRSQAFPRGRRLFLAGSLRGANTSSSSRQGSESEGDWFFHSDSDLEELPIAVEAQLALRTPLPKHQTAATGTQQHGTQPGLTGQTRSERRSRSLPPYVGHGTPPHPSLERGEDRGPMDGGGLEAACELGGSGGWTTWRRMSDNEDLDGAALPPSLVDSSMVDGSEAAQGGRSSLGGMRALGGSNRSRPLLLGEDLPSALTRASVSSQALWQATGGCVMPGELLSPPERRARERRLRNALQGSQGGGQGQGAAEGGAKGDLSTEDDDEEEEGSWDEGDYGEGGHQPDLVLESPNNFGSSVAKSFMCRDCRHVTTAAVRLPKFRVVQPATNPKQGGGVSAAFGPNGPDGCVPCGPLPETGNQSPDGADAGAGAAWVPHERPAGLTADSPVAEVPAHTGLTGPVPAAGPAAGPGWHPQVPTRKRRVRPDVSLAHAEFLVVVEVGAFTFGVWRRYSDFEKFAALIGCDKVPTNPSASNAALHSKPTRDGGGGGWDDGPSSGGDNSTLDFPNARFSWQCIKMRKRWFRCLDEEYLTVKCFLLERFLHDVLNETNDPGLVFSFIGA